MRFCLQEITLILTELYDHASRGRPKIDEDLSDLPEEKQCRICLFGLNRSGKESENVRLDKCVHKGVCRHCLRTHSSKRIRDEQSTPWIRCPVGQCPVYLTPHELFLCELSRRDMYQMARLYLQQHLNHQRSWVSCLGVKSIGTKCSFGFLLSSKIVTKTVLCEFCRFEQTVSNVNMIPDEDILLLIQEVQSSERTLLVSCSSVCGG